jgi:hypothetical protein
MKTKLILALLCLTGLRLSTAMAQQPGGGISCGGQVEKTYDRFKDQTTLKLKPQRILQVSAPRQSLDLGAEAIVKGNGPAQPKEVSLLFTSEAERWRYFEEAEAVFIVDGKRLDAGKAFATDTMPGRSTIQEKLKLTLPFDTFLEIAGGKQVEMKLGGAELHLAGKDLASLRAFSNCVTGQ